VSVAGAAGPRVAGLHAGAVWTSDDFDEPLPDDFWIGTARMGSSRPTIARTYRTPCPSVTS
jgi:hypothetical protein